MCCIYHCLDATGVTVQCLQTEPLIPQLQCIVQSLYTAPGVLVVGGGVLTNGRECLYVCIDPPVVGGL